tara:strand:+ start:1288 stop:1593 length:306 start_codon:yes stop_codon:yes gene_type:complete
MLDKVPEELQNYRREIDELDVEFVELLVRRFEIVKNVAALKARTGMDVVQSDRAEQVKQRASDMADAQGLSGDFVRSIYEMMIDHAHVIEHDIVNERRSKG